MRASSDWPHCATRTRSSTAPCRSGPKMSSQGSGKGLELSAPRNVAGTGVQDASRETSGRLLRLARRLSPIVEYPLSEPASACHDIRLNGDCNARVVKKTSLLE